MAKYKLEDFDGELDPVEPAQGYELVDFEGELDPVEGKGPKQLSREEGKGMGANFTRAFSNYLPQLQETTGAAQVLSGVVAQKLGAEETGKSWVRSGIESMEAGQGEQVVRESDSFLGAYDQGIGTVITEYLPYMVGSGLMSAAEIAASMGVGALVGAATGAGVGAAPGAIAGAINKELVKKGVKAEAKKIAEKMSKEEAKAFIEAESKKVLTEAAAKLMAKKGAQRIGATTGMAGSSVLHGMGEVTGRTVEELEKKGLRPEDMDLARVLPAAALHSVADFVADKFLMQSFKGLDITASRSLAWDVTKAIAATGTKELIPEEIQTIAERYGANLSLSDAEALKDYINTAAASYAMTVGPASVGGVRTHVAGKIEKNLNQTQEDVDKIKQKFVVGDDSSVGAASTTNVAQDPDLAPATDETGKPLVVVDQSTAIPNPPSASEVTQETQTNSAPADLNKVNEAVVDLNQQQSEALDKTPEAKEEAPKESIYEAPKKEAADYLATIESQTVKPNASILKKHVRALGLEVPAGAGFSERAIEAIKVKLGAQNVPVTDNTTGGTSATVSGQQTGIPAGGAPATVTQGLGGTDTTAVTPPVGAPAQQTPLVQATSQVAAPPVATPAFTPATPTPVATSTQLSPEDAQLRQAMIEEDQRKAAEEEQQRLAFEEAQQKRIAPTKVTPEIREEYDGTRQEMEDAIPAWEDLTADEKDVYLENIRKNTIEEHRTAGQALADYRDSKGRGAGYATSQLMPGEQRTINMYEENRKTYSEQMGIEFPSWLDLSGPARNAYLQEVTNNTPIEQDFGFMELASQLEVEGKGIRGAAKVDIEKARLAGQTEESKAVIQERVAKEKAAEESALGKGEPLPQEAIDLLKTDVNKFLEWLSANGRGLVGLKPAVGDKTYRRAATELAKTRNRAIEIIFKYLGARLSRIDFTGMTVVTENNPMLDKLRKEGKLAEYHPKTNILYITKEGLDQATVLHELIHAATVKLISRYYSNPSSLRPEEREAVEHLEKIFEFTKKQLGGKFKNAYENIYEFITYGLTDNKFQLALSQIQARPLAKYTLMMKNAWRQFTQALSKMFGLYDARASKEELPAEMYQQVAKEYSSMDPNELYNEKVMEEMEELDIVITPPTLAEPKPKEQDIKVKKVRVPTQAEKFITIAPGFEGNVLLEMAEVFERIASAPVPVAVQPLAAKKTGAQAKQPKQPKDTKESKERSSAVGDTDEKAYNVREADKLKPWQFVKNLLTTQEGHKNIVQALQNKHYRAKAWERMWERAGKIVHDIPEKINNIYTQLTLSTGRSKTLYTVYAKEAADKLESAFYKYTKLTGDTTEKALRDLFMYLEAFHDPERRMVKYIRTVPLSNNKTLNGGTVSPADRRVAIFKLLDSKQLSKAQAQQLRNELNAIVFQTDAQGNIVKDAQGKPQPNMKYVDKLGVSPRAKSVTRKGATTKQEMPIDFDNIVYSVTGLTREGILKRMQEYNNNPNKDAIDEIRKAIQELNEATRQLNKIGNFWSKPVDNYVNLYGYKDYISLKGKSLNEDQDAELGLDLDFNGKKGRDMQEIPFEAAGRLSTGENPILLTMSEAARAAMRAGRRDLTLAIKNSLKPNKLNPTGQGLIEGEVIKKIAFEDRHNVDLKDLKGKTTLFHYNQDGSIDVIAIRDKNLLESIRSTYGENHKITDIFNQLTSLVGQGHTRYNYNFAPGNFVRDTLTNAFTLGAEMSPLEAARYLGAVGSKVAQGGLAKSMKVAALYQMGDYKQLAKLAESDAYIRDMVEFINQGGMVSYIESIALKSNFESLYRDVDKNGILKTKEQADKFLDIYNEMFELASRTAAYSVIKRSELAKNASPEAAKVKAAAGAKNLANFEEVGTKGKLVGAIYMFFRPAATGAVRAIEAAAPAFRRLDTVVKSLPENLKNDPVALANFKKNYAQQQKAARYMITTLMGYGLAMYQMSALMADDDELGRNATHTDNMESWTRYARFHIPKEFTKSLGIEKPVVFQIPWGFGLGAFAAAGAQMAGFLNGAQSTKDMLSNLFLQISLDSFVPIPVSRMSPAEEPLEFLLDSMAPSLARPLLEFALNKNGLGQNIYSESNRRMGDAFVAGDNIPEAYKDAARALFKFTDGAIDWSPNSIYFFSNSYADGAAKTLVELPHGMFYLAKGEKDFNPKTDIPLFGMFFGAKGSVDARQLKSLDTKMLDKIRRYNSAKTDPVYLASYNAKYPMDELMISYYDQMKNGTLKDLQARAKEIRLMPGLTPSQRDTMLRNVKFEEALAKHDIVVKLKAYGLEP